MESCNSNSCVQCEAQVVAIVDKCGRTVSNLIPILHELQRSMGYISSEAMETVAAELGIPVGQVHGTATFYTLLYTKPQGKNIIRICDSPPCHIMGSGAILDAISKEIGIKPGETTADGNFTFEVVSCMGLCGVAPAIMVNDDVYGNLTADAIPSILSKYQEEC
ncbi:MAG: NADH-quinone oxidoreductase subunit NuoE [Armatimonadota bacterium]